MSTIYIFHTLQCSSKCYFYFLFPHNVHHHRKLNQTINNKAQHFAFDPECKN